MKDACKKEDAAMNDYSVNAYDTNDTTKGGTLLEVFALEIQLYTKRKEVKKMRAVY